jgi:hypothetical protein
VVSTPAGDVEVKGTCFRVEVNPMALSRQAVVAASVGAMAATTVLVTVYEGRVLLANERGRTELQAGEQASVRAGEAPSVAGPARGAVGATVAAADAVPAPPSGATREELLARDQAQRAELAGLRGRVRALEDEVASAKARASAKESPFFEPTKDELTAMAKECKLRWDTPSLGLTAPQMGERRASEAGISEDERRGINKVSAEMNAHVLGDLRALYVEVTGDKAGAESLDPQALGQEILTKSPEGEVKQVYARLSRERAGLAAPPTGGKGGSAAERLMRLLTTLGDGYEHDLAQVIGPERAHALRAKNNGWDNRSRSSFGCPEEGE